MSSLSKRGLPAPMNRLSRGYQEARETVFCPSSLHEILPDFLLFAWRHAPDFFLSSAITEHLSH